LIIGIYLILDVPVLIKELKGEAREELGRLIGVGRSALKPPRPLAATKSSDIIRELSKGEDDAQTNDSRKNISPFRPFSSDPTALLKLKFKGAVRGAANISL